jgi:mono/diheme cytochrome c family protein
MHHHLVSAFGGKADNAGCAVADGALESNMEKNTFKWLITATVAVAFTASGWAQRVDPGEIEFLSSCAPCHGAEGKGNGPMSAALKATPPDLTVLAKNNGGVFPFSNVYEVIDGRKVVAAHGTREMPAWGRVRSNLLYPSDKFIDPSYDPEVIVRTRILAVIDYLNHIQEK